MDFDREKYTAELDSQRMIEDINNLPTQLYEAWKEGLEKPINGLKQPESVIIAGMGGSAIGADLLAGYIADVCPVPVVVHRDYGMPAWAGDNTLVILSSHSGNTEETLSAFAAAKEQGCSMVSISKGGELTRIAREAGSISWTFEHKGQPRAAVGFSFGLLMGLFYRLGLVPDQTPHVLKAKAVMETQKNELIPETPTRRNPAKRLAGQLFGRNVTVFGSGFLTAVARRWKGQINELAKTWAQFEIIPESNHNALAGILNPQELLSKTMALFLQSELENPSNQMRAEMTREILMLQGIGTDVVNAKGDHPLANIWSLLHFGDYVAYYLAAAYRVDPGPVEILEEFKRSLREMRA